MTTADPAATPADPAVPAKVAPSLADRWLRFEETLDRWGDHLSPILVKEARQAMKSRQFVVTFSLLLIFGWLWTVIFVAVTLPGVFFAPHGPGVLSGYYVVLSIPLLIVVPYAAFRSLAGEREDGTYELLSITTLTARQIVLGKLGSAVLQMIVYYSALAPCIAFTYLLRGIDVVTIALFLAYSFLASLLLSIFGLMMATITQSRHWQILLSVVFVMALLGFVVGWDSAMLSLIFNMENMPFDQADFWMANLCILSFYVPFAILMLLIAAGQITFASENRSTPIRAVLIVPPAMLIVWCVYYWLRIEFEGPLFMLAIFGGIYWTVVGAFLTGESAQLSPRAMRGLPQTIAGRMAFTWFNPGSATGYMFALLNLLTLLLVGTAVVVWGIAAHLNSPPELEVWFPLTICILAYVAGYVGLTHLFAVFARRVAPITLLAAFLLQLILVLMGALVPFLLQIVLGYLTNTPWEYSWLQLPNWAWTLSEIGGWRRSAVGFWEVTIIAGCGLAIFLANLIVAAREVEFVRQQAPRRVLEDDAALHPAALKTKKSPWD
ncbi:MAG: hypothetical protein SFU86_22230 [Pirellulaceae bacterium]|nr:hypothetical protein [Pirellulaceae bacterium]